MDAYLKYVKDLHARGFSPEQIQDNLKALKLDADTQKVLLDYVRYLSSAKKPEIQQPPPPRLPQAPVAQPDHARIPTTMLPVYLEYVKLLLGRGKSKADIDMDLADRGVDDVSKTILFQLADETVTPKTEPQSMPAEPAVSITNREKELESAAEKLEVAAEHLAKVADRLEAVEEHQDESVLENNQIQNTASHSDVQQIQNVADRVESVADKLESTQGAALPQAASLPRQPAAMPPEVTPIPVQQPANAMQTQTATALPQASAANAESLPKFNAGLLAAFAGLYILLLVFALHSSDRTVKWLALLSMNVVGTAGFNLVLRRSSWKHEDQWLTATILQTGLFIPFLFKEIVSPIHFPAYTPFEIMLLGIAVSGLMSLQFFNVKALERLEASVFSVVYNTRILFITLLGTFFLSESIGLWAMLGGLLIFLAVFIVKQKGSKSITKQGVIFALGAALAMSIMNTCEKELIKLVGYEQYIFPLFLCAAIIMWGIVYARKTKNPLQLLTTPHSFLLMALRACAGIGFSYALVFGPVAVSSYISSLSVVLLVVFGMLFLNERDFLKSKIQATAVAILGLTFILIDSLR